MLLASMLLAVVLGAGGGHGGRILGLFATPAKSHSRVFEALFQGLAARGHEVTFASPFGLQWPSSAASGGSIKGVRMDDGDVVGSVLGDVVGPNRSPLSETFVLWKIAPQVCRNELMEPQVQDIIQAGKNKTLTFDLVVVESFFFDCFVPFAKLFDAPLVLFSSQWAPKWAHQAMGSPDPWATSPYMFLPYSHSMTFSQRLHNALFSAFTLAARKWRFISLQDQVVQEIFGDEYKSIEELESKAALLLINSHPITNSPQATLPNVIEVGGLHITPAKPLSKDLQMYLDESKNGVILLSLGSLISKDSMDPERLQTLVQAMAQLGDYSILWRWDTEEVPNLSANVKIMPWIPQRDVLAHPKVLLFVTHGGLLSGQEATYEGVPRVVMPFFGDQQMNAQRVIESGVGLVLNYYSASADQIVHTVKTILSNKSFSKKAKELSKAFRDQPQSPLERAVFWSEYVMKHRDIDHLRSTSVNLFWFQNVCLDILVFLVATLAAVIFILLKIGSILANVCRGSKQKSE